VYSIDDAAIWSLILIDILVDKSVGLMGYSPYMYMYMTVSL